MQQTFPADRYFLSSECRNESNGFEVFHNHSIVETIDGRDNTIIKTSTGLRYEITDLLYLNVSLDWDHESEPAGTAEDTDTTFVIGAGLEFD